MANESFFKKEPADKKHVEILEALKREVGMRHQVYERQVLNGKMTKEKAQHEIDCFQILVNRMQAEHDRNSGTQSSLF